MRLPANTRHVGSNPTVSAIGKPLQVSENRLSAGVFAYLQENGYAPFSEKEGQVYKTRISSGHRMVSPSGISS